MDDPESQPMIDNGDDQQDKTLSDPVTHCCCCFPVRCGLMTIGVCNILAVIGLAYECYVICNLAFSLLPVFCVMKIILLVIMLFVCFKFVRYMMEDSKEMREGLVVASIAAIVNLLGTYTLYMIYITKFFAL